MFVEVGVVDTRLCIRRRVFAKRRIRTKSTVSCIVDATRFVALSSLPCSTSKEVRCSLRLGFANQSGTKIVTCICFNVWELWCWDVPCNAKNDMALFSETCRCSGRVDVEFASEQVWINPRCWFEGALPKVPAVVHQQQILLGNHVVEGNCRSVVLQWSTRHFHVGTWEMEYGIAEEQPERLEPVQFCGYAVLDWRYSERTGCRIQCMMN